MFEDKLQYMMSNDPSETISQKGSNVRKKIRPLFINVLKLGNKLKLIVEKNEYKKIGRPVIYVASHGFKDDVLNTILTLKDNAYVVFGNIDLFYNTFDGLCLWVYGTQLVNRYDKSSKNAMKEKMDKILEYGNNIVIFSEATWNLSPNRPMENLHWGFYDVAIKNNALVVPVVTTKVGKKCYSRVLQEIDLKQLSEEDINSIYITMKQYIEKAIDLNIYEDFSSKELNNVLLKLNSYIDLLASFSGIEKSRLIINEIQTMCEKIVEDIKGLKEKINAEELEYLAFDLISKLVFRIGTAEKEVKVIKIRDLMATEKYDMYEKHPDYSYMDEKTDKYAAWDLYLKDTIAATPYFYPEPEATTLYKDSLISTKEEVMPWLDEKIKIKK